MTNNSKITVKPNDLKGREIDKRIIELMGQTLIKENVDRSTIELTKRGPDGKVYGIVRENHEWFIKTADDTESLTKESFKYIGGLQNKKDFAYPSYAKAIKQLNQKFKSLNESLGIKTNINVFRNDNLFENEADKNILDKKGEELDDGKPKEEGGTNLVGKTGNTKKAKNDFTKVKVEMTEDETRIDGMITGEEVNEEEVVEESMLGAASFFQGDDIILNNNDTLSISHGVDVLDDAIANATGEKKVTEMKEAEDILKGLTNEEVISILEKVTGKKKS